MPSKIETITVKPSQAARALEACILSRQPVFLHGAPGVGKSQVVRQTTARLDYQFKDDRAVLKDPVDLRGLPYVENGRSHWATPDDFPRDGQGVWFLDELNRAPMLVQNAYFQLVLDRRLGDYELPEGWAVVAAGNRESDGGGITRLPQALANRFVHLNVEPDLEDWCSWAVQNGVNPVVIAFLRYRPNLLHEYSRDEHAFPTPRSWEFVSRIVGRSTQQDIEMALVAGAVGHGAAVEFMSFIKLYRSLPSIDAIILHPTVAPVPTDSATLYAVSSALSMRAEPENFASIFQYLDRIPPEYAVFSIRYAVLRNSQLQTMPEFTKWAIANAGLLGSE